jgi:hypothetical protein
MDFFVNMSSLEKAFWFIALPASLIFIIQTIMTFMGADASDGTEADFDGDLADSDAPFQLFSLRNLINFLLGFSWSGISFYKTIQSQWLLILVAFLFGALFVFLFFVIIRQVQKLAEDNSFNLKNTIGKTASVYLKIPENKSGFGKVQISVKGSFHELNAITNGEELPTGTMIKVLEIVDDNLILVEKI